ncbi:MAG: sulfatase-like hydrolase/transferase [Bacteroidales bacterium]|nr:sulfatase-like hydrolase/transferase [Bacteroidales bacterium]
MRDRSKIWVAFSTDGDHTWSEPRFAFSITLAETLNSPLKNHGCSYLDAFVDVINRADESPFFLIYAPHDPHNPWNYGNPDKYNPDAVEIPAYLIDCPETRAQIIRYYAEITYMDWQFGQLLDYLDKEGLTDNTIVIFTSEQGSSFPFAEWTCYDNGLKTYFIMRWPGHIKPGTRNAALTQYVDVIPTLFEAVGVRPEKINTGISDAEGYTGFDGKSFLKVLSGKKRHRKYVYGVYATRGIISGSEAYPIRSIRSRKYKYIINMNHEVPFSNNL